MLALVRSRSAACLLLCLGLALGCNEGAPGPGSTSTEAPPAPPEAPADPSVDTSVAEATEAETAAGDAAVAGTEAKGDPAPQGKEAVAEAGKAEAEANEAPAVAEEAPAAAAPAAPKEAASAKGTTEKTHPCGVLSLRLAKIVTSKDPRTAAAKIGLLVGDNQLRVMLEMHEKEPPPSLDKSITVELQAGSRMQLLTPMDQLCALGTTDGVKSLQSPKRPSPKSKK